MLLVGLTGGIASGKSVVAELLRHCGARVVDADVLAREVVAPGTDGLKAIVERFGPGVITPDGQLDRGALGEIVFGDPRARRDLNAITHPRIAKLARTRAREAADAGARVVVYDAALLFENGIDRDMDTVVVVDVDGPTQRQRLKNRDALSPSQIEARIDAQMPLEDKVARADHVIDNRGDIESTRAQVLALWQKLTSDEVNP
ncbi:MAG: dephospho-CoA kinase [Deltaproteobacteria bacterium]|nr:dephospho-CoA kinase [Deltaproteobacteria bacterium]